MKIKYFELATVLSITTNKILTSTNKIEKLITFLTNKNINKNTLINDIQLCKNIILEKYPFLYEIGTKEKFKNKTELNKFIEEQIEIYGNSFEFTQKNRKELTKKIRV